MSSVEPGADHNLLSSSSNLVPHIQTFDMKDISSASNRHTRNSFVYQRKRTSPHGISKYHKSPLIPVYGQNARSPRSAKSALILQRQRDATALALRREGYLLENEYREEIRTYMHEMEKYTMPSAQCMDQQPEIRWSMRPCLLDFVIEIHFSFRLRPETLYLTLNIIDRYVSRRVVYVKHYQLVGCAALWIAAKFEDAKERVPTVAELVQMCHDTYEEAAFIQMEGHVLTTIQWTLGHPTAEAWLRVLCCGPSQEDAKVQHVARFLMEVTMFYRDFVKYPPSSIAMAALTLARFVCRRSPRSWDETDESMEVVDLLDSRLSNRLNDLSETLVKKYSYAFYSKAATLVVQFYLEGNHFVSQDSFSSQFLPVTPSRSVSASSVNSPMSTSTSASDLSDDYPLTPPSSSSPSTLLYSDPVVVNGSFTHDDKENMHSSFDPVITKAKVDSPPEQFLPHDFVTFSRPALHNLNASPRAMVS